MFINFSVFICILLIIDKVFSFLSQDEVEKLKQEEERKIATLTRDELKSWAQIDEHEGLEDDDNVEDQDSRRPKYEHPQLLISLIKYFL